jgi:uncharacterized protein involved in exopolysaccharide biosynthesis/Mrp family chromosome partitioning ATPase
LGAGVAGFVSFAIPSRYQATAQLIIDPRELRILQNEVTPGAVGSDSTTAYAESQARVIASDSVKMRLIERENLDTDPEFVGNGSSGIGAVLLRSLWGDTGPSKNTDPMLAALRALEKKIVVRRGERTFVIDVSATSEDPEKAARLANGLANAYLDDQSSVRSETAKRTAAALGGRLVELRQKLRDAEDKAEQFKASKDIVGVGGKLVNDEQLSLLNAQLQGLRAKTVEARAKYEQVRAIRGASIESAALPEAVASNTITALRSQLGAALNREADMLAAMGPRHPALTAARSQVQDARRQIADELGRIGQAARVDLDRTLAAEKALTAQVETLKRAQTEASRSFVELREFEREIESARAIYEAFFRRAREAAEQVGVDTTNARIISAAAPPDTASGASRKAIVLLGCLLGLGLGTGFALARRFLGKSAPAALPARQVEASRMGLRASILRLVPGRARTAPASTVGMPKAVTESTITTKRVVTSPATAAQDRNATVSMSAAGIPVLATVPKVTSRRWKRGQSELASVFQGKGFVVDSYEDPASAFAKAIRQVRNGLTGGRPANRKILVTSLRPGTGCSTIALNLALAAANEGRIPLLVDAGQGERSLTAVFAEDATLGLADVISGSAGMVRAALQDEETGLFFLPRLSNVAIARPALTRDILAKAFYPAVRRFDCVVIDGATLDLGDLTRSFADSVDDIVIVTTAGFATADLARAETLLGPERIRGCVINRA